MKLHLVRSVVFCLQLWFYNAGSQSPQKLQQLQQLQLPVDNHTRVIWSSPKYSRPTMSQPPIINLSSLSSSPPRLEAGLFEGLFIRNRTLTLPGQAIAGILFESFFTMTYRVPEFKISTFDYTVSYPTGGPRYPLDASIHIRSTNLPEPYQMTNSRLSVALNTLGNHFNEHWNLNEMHEWDFDIAICYFSIGAIKIIGSGSIVQGLSAPG